VVAEGDCWRAADLRAQGLVAPEDPKTCISPCPGVTRRAGEVLDVVALARRQLRVGFSGACGLDFTVIARLADDCGVRTDAEWWRMVALVEDELMAVLNPPKPEDHGPEG
jgi:hypothetical protein